MEAVQPILERVSPLPIPPPFVLSDTLAELPPLDQTVNQPLPSWTFARKRPTGFKMPQTIAHRGYKAKHPENTMGAFHGAVAAGVQAIETDIHLTQDNVAVLSHDATLKRCFGKNEKIIDCTWDYISQQRTLVAPHEPMPRLQDLLAYLAAPGLEDIWLLLDIKMDNDADTVMRQIALTVASIPPNPFKPWPQRIVLGCWAAKYLPLCSKYLPSLPITHIGFSIPYARQFLTVPNVSFNIFQETLMLPYFGAKFLRDAKAKQRPVYVWTVNEDEMMKWSISNGLDGVITDDPKRFLEVCEEWEAGKRAYSVSWGQWLMIAWINFMIVIFGTIFWWKYGGVKGQKRKGVKAVAFAMKQKEAELAGR